MGDPGGQLAERGELLRLDQAVLRLVQIGERLFGGEPGLARFPLADPQLLGAGVDLGLQGIVRFLHLGGHLVEPIGQGLDLVAGMDLDRLAAFARAQPLGPDLQIADRHHHAPGEQGPGHRRQQQAEHQQRRRPPQRGINRRQRLAQRQLDKNDPAEPRHRRESGQHRLAGGARGGMSTARRGIPAQAGQGRGDLRQMRQIGLAQHQAEVGMGDQPAVRTDHIGISGPADPHRPDQIPDEPQIDLSGGHPGIMAGMRDRDRHIGLGIVAEIDRAEPDAVRLCVGKARLGRVVGAARHDIGGEPRHLQHLLSRPVDLGHFADRRHFAQQPNEIVAPLLERQRVPSRRGRPAELLLDIADDMRDALGGFPSVLLLHSDRGVLGFTVGEPQVDRAVDDQNKAHQPDKGEHQLGREPHAQMPPGRLARGPGRRECDIVSGQHETKAPIRSRRRRGPARRAAGSARSPWRSPD